MCGHLDDANVRASQSWEEARSERAPVAATTAAMTRRA